MIVPNQEEKYKGSKDQRKKYSSFLLILCVEPVFNQARLIYYDLLADWGTLNLA
jgi:hypothetical protein